MEPDILEYAAHLECHELHMVVDEKVGLRAIIAIHNTNLGPALGGCRLHEYPSTAAAAIDVIRLAQGMTYKAAMANLPLGGGKMVILKPKTILNHKAFFESAGRFVNRLNGRYITATDSGTTTEDMDIVASQTPYVTTKAHGPLKISDSGITTAHGVIRGIEAAVKFKLGRDDLNGIHISFQGVGHVGQELLKELTPRGVKATIYDIDQAAMEKCVREFGVQPVSSLEALLAVKSDVFAPCAYGAILNDDTIPQIQSPIVVGCANNQLDEPRHGLMLKERGILYGPDYVVNAGGLIYVAVEFGHITEKEAEDSIQQIYDRSLQIFERAKIENRATSDIADAMARERVADKSKSYQW